MRTLVDYAQHLSDCESWICECGCPAGVWHGTPPPHLDTRFGHPLGKGLHPHTPKPCTCGLAALTAGAQALRGQGAQDYCVSCLQAQCSCGKLNRQDAALRGSAASREENDDVFQVGPAGACPICYREPCECPQLDERGSKGQAVEPSTVAASPEPSVRVETLKDRILTQAFVAGQMDAQLKHADDLTRPSLALLKERTYLLARESADELIAAVAADRRECMGRIHAFKFGQTSCICGTVTFDSYHLAGH